MKCFSRSTFGVFVGSLCIFECCAISADIIMSLYLDENKQPASQVLVLALFLINYLMLITCFMIAIVSGLLVAGIIKRRSMLMKPWLYFALAALVYQCLRLVIMHHYYMFDSLFFGLLLLIVQIFTFYPIYTLYEDIHKANNEAVQTDPNREPQNYNRQVTLI